MKGTRLSMVILALLLVATLTAGAAGQAAGQDACGHACLSGFVEDFLKRVSSRDFRSIPVADVAEIRENGKIAALHETAWSRVKTIRSRMTFADPVTGNVVFRAGVELDDGKPGYISTRLKFAAGRITDIEMSSDTSSRVVSAYIWNLDPLFSSVLPAGQRMTRVELEALARRYFHSLSTHVAVAADFDERCNRYHSGQQITNVARNTIEGGPPRTCASSLEGNPPWGPATEQRFPVVDPERGIVFGIALLHYPKLPGQPKMYVSEIFKVISGKIVKIDNIGLMLQGVDTLGFVH